MPATSSYDYADHSCRAVCGTWRVINVGIILFCRTRRFLGALIQLDEARLHAFAPSLDFAFVQQHLDYRLRSAMVKKRVGRSASSRNPSVSTGSSRRAAPSSRHPRSTLGFVLIPLLLYNNS